VKRVTLGRRPRGDYTAAMRSAVLLLALAGTAYANGRAPVTNGTFFKPNDPHSLYVRSTFGLLISHDDGCTFDWVCEDNIGYNGAFDPKYAIGADGAIFAATQNGLRVSRDGGCSFTTATPDEFVDAFDLAPNGDIWIGTASIGQMNDVYHSIDGAMTFSPMGMATSTGFYRSIEVAPSDPRRIYLTSNETAGTPAMHLFRSDDTGAMFAPEPLAGVIAGSFPVAIVAAVDPANPDVVYLVSVGANPPNGDRLYRSTDGAVTFQQVLATDNKIRDVVIADAQHVFATTTVILINGSEIGGPAFVSTNAGLAFSQLASAPQLDCLAKRPDGVLVGCGANWQPDYMAVATSTDGATWQKVWRFVNMAGPLACPPGTAEHDRCDVQLWSGVQQQFGTTGPACGVNAVDGARDGATTKSGGCCDGGGAAGAWWAAALALWLTWTCRRAPRRGAARR